MKKNEKAKDETESQLIQLKKGEVIQLNNILINLKIGTVSKEGAFALLDAKIVLTPFIKSIEDTQKLAAEDLKPEALNAGKKDPDLEKKWNEKFIEFMSRHLEEEISIKLPKLSREDLYELIKINNLEIGKAEILNVLI